MIKIGSLKYPNGEVWDYEGQSKIVQIFVSHSDVIDFFQFLYVDDNGAFVLSEKHGGLPGNNFNTVKLDYPDEFLTSLRGSYSCHGMKNVLTSIRFGTNHRNYGQFGCEHKNDSKFNFQMGEDSPFGGFHGTTTTRDGELESVGVYIKPMTTWSTPLKKVESDSDDDGELERQKLDESIMIKIGSLKYPNGEVWDYKGQSKIVQIFVSHSDVINFFQFLYVDDNGAFVLSEKHGGMPGNKFNTVKLDYPDEFITSLRGSYRCRGPNYILTSIRFGTNYRTYGRFGWEHWNDSQFNFQMGEDRPFGGFHGTTTRDGELESIGVYIKPMITWSTPRTRVRSDSDDDSDVESSDSDDDSDDESSDSDDESSDSSDSDDDSDVESND